MSVGRAPLVASSWRGPPPRWPDWDLEIIEVHHRAKLDAPSGTALRLAEAARGARTAATHLVHGRQGKPGPRAAGELGMHALRGGDVVGDHTVHLMGGGERLELAHRATTRADVFAQGRDPRRAVDRGPPRRGATRSTTCSTRSAESPAVRKSRERRWRPTAARPRGARRRGSSSRRPLCRDGRDGWSVTMSETPVATRPAPIPAKIHPSVDAFVASLLLLHASAAAALG